MRLLEDVGNFLEKLVKRDPALVVSLLSDFVEFFEVGDFEDGFIDQVPEELLRLLDELDVAVGHVDLLEESLLFDPVLDAFVPFR